MKNLKKLIFTFIIISLSLTQNMLQAQQLAFPGAEGFGRFATGGRTGEVYHVTNLNDSGEGSFRDAVSQSNRIVVFDVGGVINLESVCVVEKNITIAGQTAPGDGITIYGHRLAFNSNSGNSIIRYIRVRLGSHSGGKDDAMSISDNADNLIYDHVSVSWGRDGTFDINSSEAENITIQDCIIGQGLNKDNHSTGGLIQCGPISIIRTLWIDNKTRNPKIRFQHEFINSVVYNWAEDGYIMGGESAAISECNMIGSYFIYGPSSSGGHFTRSSPTFSIYQEDNWVDKTKDGTLNGTLIPGTGYLNSTIVNTPFDFPGVNNVLSAADAVEHVINNAGASFVRDEVDELLIEQLKSLGTKGAIITTEADNGIEGNVGLVGSGTLPTDTDGDGMPDEWEDANGTQKGVDDAMVIASNGYANIENYINSISTENFTSIRYPNNISASFIGSDMITFEWTNREENADQINIEYGKTSNNLDHTINLSGDETTTNVTGLESATTYYFRFQVVKGDETSSYSPIISIQTLEAAIPPIASSNPSPMHQSTIGFKDNIILTWENNTSLLGGSLFFDVFFGTSETSMELISEGQNKLSVEVGDLEVGTTYYWKVKTTNKLGSHQGITWKFTVDGEKQNILYLPFDETSGTSADNVASVNDAIGQNFNPVWTEGLFNNSINFNSGAATNAAMVIEHYDALSMGTSPFTISLWFKSDGSGISDAYIFNKGTHSSDYGALGTGKWIGLQYKKGSRLTFAIDDNSSKSDLNISSPDDYFDDTWHHVVCIRDVAADKLKMYIDGELAGETNDNTGNITEQAEFVIGNSNYNFNAPYKGSLDELQIFNEVLTEPEINYLANSGLRINDSLIAGISSNERNNITITPNPFNDEIRFSLENDYGTDLDVRIYDLLGKVVFYKNFENNGNEIIVNDLNTLSSGIYTCVINTGSKQLVTKVLKK